MRSAQEAVHLVAATAGFISFYLIAATTIWGLVLRNGWALTRVRHSTIYGLHQTLALLGLCLALVHGFTQLAVPGGPVTLIDQFVPFLSDRHPVGVGLGTVALELMVAAALSILIQRRLGYRRWRVLHSVTHVAFTLLVAHVLIAGSDVGFTWAWSSVLVCWLIAVLLWVRSSAVIPRLRALELGSRSAGGRRSGTGSAAADRVEQPRGAEFAVHVDASRCARSGFCTYEAPEVFTLTSGGLTYPGRIPARLGDGVDRAIAVCPERAIALGRTPGGTHRRRAAKSSTGTP